jgi:hypothetical protein
MVSTRPASGCYFSVNPLYWATPSIRGQWIFCDGHHFRISCSAESAKLPILVSECEGSLVAATCSERRRALTTPALLRALVALPLLTLKIVAAHCWIRLWLKGVRSVPKHIATANVADMSLAGSESHAYIRLKR